MDSLKVTTLFFCLIFIALSNGSRKLERVRRLVGGTKAKFEDWPFIVHLNFHDTKTKFKICGGALIECDLVLTAAQCVDYVYDKPELVTVGVKRIKPSSKAEPGKNFTVQKIFVHEKYKLHKERKSYTDYSLAYDIAILKLSCCIKKAAFVRLPQQDDNSYGYNNNIPCKLAAWGQTKPVPSMKEFYNYIHERGDHLMEKLQYIHGKKRCINDDKLKKYMSFYNNLDGILCGGDPAGSQSASCFGDSGSPLMCKSLEHEWVVLGILITEGFLCKPGISHKYFTDVSKHKNWIENIITNNQ